MRRQWQLVQVTQRVVELVLQVDVHVATAARRHHAQLRHARQHVIRETFHHSMMYVKYQYITVRGIEIKRHTKLKTHGMHMLNINTCTRMLPLTTMRKMVNVTLIKLLFTFSSIQVNSGNG